MPLVYTNGIVFCVSYGAKMALEKQENQIHLSKTSSSVGAQARRLRSVSRLVNLWLKRVNG